MADEEDSESHGPMPVAPPPPAAPMPHTPVKRRMSTSPFCSPSSSVFDSGGNRREVYGSHKRRKPDHGSSSKKLGFPGGPPVMPGRPSSEKKERSRDAENNGGSAPGDRFIPCRSGMDMDVGHYFITQAGDENADRKKRPPFYYGGGFTPLKPEFQRTLKETLLHSPGSGSFASPRNGLMDSMAREGSVLSFHDYPTPPKDLLYTSPLKAFQSDRLEMLRSSKVNRHIPLAPSRILDAPDLVDDYYLNLLSWSRRNVLSVALGQSVYLWNADSGAIDHLLTLENRDDYVTSVSWMDMEASAHIIAVGTNTAEVHLYDSLTLQRIRTLTGHTARVGALSWNESVVTSGGRDALIMNHDIRVASGRVRTLVGHQQEICGLRWSPDGSTLASGGNENYLCLWDVAHDTSGPRSIFTEHQAAVKALAWCPFHRRILASGGGTADRTIKFWNTGTNVLLNSVDTGSQVCALMWSKHNKELVSSHGFSENQLCLWKYPCMAKVREFKGHSARVLHLDQSPDGLTVVSAAADETLRFWEIMGPANGKQKKIGLEGGSLVPSLSTGTLPRSSSVFNGIR